jgi:hypothetical protein
MARTKLLNDYIKPHHLNDEKGNNDGNDDADCRKR